MGGLPSILVNPPWTTLPPRRSRVLVQVVAPRPYATTVRWRPGEAERLRARPATTRFLSMLAHGSDLDPILERIPDADAEDLAALGRIDSPRLVRGMASWLGTARSRARARAWLVAHPEAAASVLVPMALGHDRKERTVAQRALELLPPDVVRAEADALGVRAAIEETVTLDPLARVPAKLPTLGPSIVVERLTRPEADGVPLDDEALANLVTMVLLSTPAEPYAGLAIVRAELSGLSAWAWEAFEAWLAVGAPAKEDWPLAALAAFGDDGVARKLAPLVRAWPGEFQSGRAAKGLDVLAAIGTDVALMHLHGIAEKVKYRALQERARTLVEEIADRRGLGADELGDRLVPDLGLDADGSRTLDFGKRRFRIGFDEQLVPFVVDAAGKRLAAFPKPTKSDDPERAAVAVATWRALKADAKTIAAAQIHRLERAMMESRRWTIAAFTRDIVVHPLVGHLARRIVWTDGVVPFRVAEDRTFATVDDDPYLPVGEIGIAHRLQLEDPSAWQRLFADYELISPFPQLDRETFAMTDAERESRISRRFVGTSIHPRSLFSLEHRGWRRGLVEEGTWIHDLHRTVRDGEEEWLAVLTFAEEAALPVFGDDERVPLGALLLEHDATFGALSPIAFSELVRDIARLAR